MGRSHCLVGSGVESVCNCDAICGDGPSIRQGPDQKVELGDHQGVAGPARSERLPEPGSLAVGAGQAVVDVDALGETPSPARVSPR